MVIAAHRMNTVKINRKDMRQFKEDIKQMHVKHGPFRKVADSYYIDILNPASAHSFFILKYFGG